MAYDLSCVRIEGRVPSHCVNVNNSNFYYNEVVAAGQPLNTFEKLRETVAHIVVTLTPDKIRQGRRVLNANEIDFFEKNPTALKAPQVA